MKVPMRNTLKEEILAISCSDISGISTIIPSFTEENIVEITNLGNILSSNQESTEQSTLSYALSNGIRHIIVFGHSNCRAMKELFTDQDKDSNVFKWLKNINTVKKKLIKEYEEYHHESMELLCKDHNVVFQNEKQKELVDSAAKENVIYQLKQLKENFEIKEKIQKNELELHGWYHDSELNTVLVYDEKSNLFTDIKERSLKNLLN